MSAATVYAPPRFDQGIDLDLSKNEGLPPPAAILESVQDAQSVIGRYPDIGLLAQQLADRHGLAREQVLVTAGGDDALFRCFLSRAGQRAVSTRPSFEMISRYAAQTGSELAEIEWWEDPFPTAEFVAALNGDTAFVVSPNNPTGSVITESDLGEISEAASLLVLDTAYAEFADQDLTPAALEMDNVVIIRTLSKAWGLAGLRVGYLLGPPDLISNIATFGNPYPVSALSATLANERLGAGAQVKQFRDEVKREREELTELLVELGARPLASQGNFVLAEFADSDWLVTSAASLGVALRHFPDRPELEGFVRITVPGRQDLFERLVATLSVALAPKALIFDIDGVLADVSNSQTAAIVQTAASYGVSVDRSDIEEAKAKGNTSDDWETTRLLCAQAGVEAPIAQVTERFEKLYQGSPGEPGLKAMESALVDPVTWERWAAKFPIAVVTGRPRSDAEEFLERFDLMGKVSALVTRDEAPLKPDPASVRLALETLGVSRAWMLGDTPDDLVAARAAGVVPIGVLAPGDDPDKTRRSMRAAALILESTVDLEGLIK